MIAAKEAKVLADTHNGIVKKWLDSINEKIIKAASTGGVTITMYNVDPELMPCIEEKLLLLGYKTNRGEKGIDRYLTIIWG